MSDRKRYRCFVGGSRNFELHCRDPLEWFDGLICITFETLHPHSAIELASGDSGAIDKLVERYANWAGIPFTAFPADWSLGKAAGPIRNRSGCEWAADGPSRGTVMGLRRPNTPGSMSLLQEAKRARVRRPIDLCIPELR